MQKNVPEIKWLIVLLVKEVKKYFKDNMDITGMSDEEILEASEVFPLPDGRFLIVEG